MRPLGTSGNHNHRGAGFQVNIRGLGFFEKGAAALGLVKVGNTREI